MRPIVRIAAVEIPVRDLPRAAAWYQRALGLEQTWTDGRSAMLRSAPDEAGASLSIFLVETNDARRLAFASTHTGIVHSVVDFHIPDLEGLHAHLKAIKTDVEDLRPGARRFGFRDPDGNRLAATAAAGLAPSPAPGVSGGASRGPA